MWKILLTVKLLDLTSPAYNHCVVQKVVACVRIEGNLSPRCAEPGQHTYKYLCFDPKGTRQSRAAMAELNRQLRGSGKRTEFRFAAD